MTKRDVAPLAIAYQYISAVYLGVIKLRFVNLRSEFFYSKRGAIHTNRAVLKSIEHISCVIMCDLLSVTFHANEIMYRWILFNRNRVKLTETLIGGAFHLMFPSC